MTLTHTALRGVSLSLTGVGVFFTAVASLEWAFAIAAWGNPGPFSTAMLWSFGTVLVFAAVGVIDWLRNRGD